MSLNQYPQDLAPKFVELADKTGTPVEDVAVAFAVTHALQCADDACKYADWADVEARAFFLQLVDAMGAVISRAVEAEQDAGPCVVFLDKEGMSGQQLHVLGEVALMLHPAMAMDMVARAADAAATMHANGGAPPLVRIDPSMVN